MSGITGFVSENSTFEDLEKQTRLLARRGPDGEGFFFESPVGLGYRHRSVIDSETVPQPLISEDKNRIIVFDGEIYNYQILKNELIDLGQKFTQSNQAELVLNAFNQWGLETFMNRMEGEFAFAIWDKSIQKLFVVRDKFGVKPLYYTQSTNGIFFGSELKSLKAHTSGKEISKTGFNLFFSLGYIPAPYTIYEDVFKLEAGHYLEFSKGELKKTEYFDYKSIYNQCKNELITDYQQAKNQLRELLFNSVELRMNSTGAVGSFLSGGIDSAVVSSIMSKISEKPVDTFCIGFKEKAYDESDRAELVASHIDSNHHLYVIDHTDLLEVTDETLAYFDEPFGDAAAIPAMVVAARASKEIKVVLTGDCADELFGGYEKYLAGYYAKKYNRYPGFLKSMLEFTVGKIPHNNQTNHLLRKVKKVIKSAKSSPAERYLQLASLGFHPEEKESLFRPEYDLGVENIITRFFEEQAGDELSRTFYSDIKLVLEGAMFPKVDRTCLYNSLEARAPFFDSQIVDFAAHLPHHFKIDGTNKKRILKDTFADMLPEQTIGFGKKGFGIPIRLWFQNELKDELSDLLSPDRIEKQGILNPAYTERLLNEHLSNKENHSDKLWLLFVFQKWYKTNHE